MSGVDSGGMGHRFLWLSSIASTRKVNLAVISSQLLIGRDYTNHDAARVGRGHGGFATFASLVQLDAQNRIVPYDQSLYVSAKRRFWWAVGLALQSHFGGTLTIRATTVNARATRGARQFCDPRNTSHASGSQPRDTRQ